MQLPIPDYSRTPQVWVCRMNALTSSWMMWRDAESSAMSCAVQPHQIMTAVAMHLLQMKSCWETLIARGLRVCWGTTLKASSMRHSS